MHSFLWCVQCVARSSVCIALLTPAILNKHCKATFWNQRFSTTIGISVFVKIIKITIFDHGTEGKINIIWTKDGKFKQLTFFSKWISLSNPRSAIQLIRRWGIFECRISTSKIINKSRNFPMGNKAILNRFRRLKLISFVLKRVVFFKLELYCPYMWPCISWIPIRMLWIKLKTKT